MLIYWENLKKEKKADVLKMLKGAASRKPKMKAVLAEVEAKADEIWPPRKKKEAKEDDNISDTPEQEDTV